MNRKSYYIAHRITQRHYIRDTVCSKLRKSGITPINPFYKANKKARAARLDITYIDSGEVNPYTHRKTLEDCKDIVIRDLKLIDKADGVISFLTEASVGTSMEIFYCAYVLRKPIYIVTEKYSGHPWLIYLTKLSRGFKVRSLEQLIKRIDKLK